MLKDLLLTCRSYRSFDNTVRLSDELLRSFIDCARLTPSSINMQMIKFRLVNSPQECAKVLAQTRWAGKLKELRLPPKGHEPTAYVVICTDKEVIPTAESFLKDVGICAQTVMLAAVEAGFGGCMIGSFDRSALQTALGLPAHLSPALVLALGKPDERVVITDPAPDGSVTYYRENGIHYVQKRKLDDLIIK